MFNEHIPISTRLPRLSNTMPNLSIYYYYRRRQKTHKVADSGSNQRMTSVNKINILRFRVYRPYRCFYRYSPVRSISS